MKNFASVADYLRAVPPAPRAALMKTHQKALAPYKMSKGPIQFTVGKPLPTALVRKLVKARIAENERRR